ncbi:hypothetical protein GCM10011297_10350 [Bacterioplanes sanyensis]|uniref:hypothetical protein n=1 Tax=Bacterioplanes sanyensis TaxID=1249553 RepID=UPI0016790B04|nr:hypothetical protein [Bacterioplanes sanyensis]GGY39077.1 hypothetical protein GCM10011297_10350 [Bacterioplanes sanyensis]
MTAQLHETLDYQGQRYSMISTPLSDYLTVAKETPRFLFSGFHLVRGYLGHWQILDQHLYLTDLSHTSIMGEHCEMSLGDVFPGYDERVFAHWYSGTLTLIDGQLKQYRHQGFASDYQQYLLLQIERGKLIGQRHSKNKGPA